MFRVYVWLGKEKLIGNLIFVNTLKPVYIAILEQEPFFPSYKKIFKKGDYVIVKDYQGNFIVLRKLDIPISQISSEWVPI